MAAASVTDAQPKPYTSYFVYADEYEEKIPAYLKNTGHTPEEVLCRTKGKWPEWLYGTFLRMGTSMWRVPLSEDGSKPDAICNHWFDGLGCLHKFNFSRGTVRYQSRTTADGLVRNAKKKGHLDVHHFSISPNTPLKYAQDPCSAELGGMQSVFMQSAFRGTSALKADEGNVNVVPRRGFAIPADENSNQPAKPASNPEKDEIVVTTDFNLMQVVDAKSLEPKRLITYGAIDSELEGVGICAHPCKDRIRGHLYNYLIDPKTGQLSVFALDYKNKPSKLVWKTVLPCAPAFAHSVAMTKKYFVFARIPMYMDVSDEMRPLAEALKIEEDTPTVFFVLDKDDGRIVAKYESTHFWFYHSVNAFDYIDPETADENICIDLCVYRDVVPSYREYLFSNLINPARPFSDGLLTRFELPAVNKTSLKKPGLAKEIQVIEGATFELPRISKVYSMNPQYRYVYACSGIGAKIKGPTKVSIGMFPGDAPGTKRSLQGGIAKGDWKTGKSLVWWPENGESCPCEPVFVERPGAKDEDDGVVLTIIINDEGTYSILIALDGKTMKEIARAEMPQVYGLGPHGSFVEDGLNGI